MLGVAINAYALALAVPVAVVLLWLFQFLHVEYRLSKCSAVRAPRLARNPISGQLPASLSSPLLSSLVLPRSSADGVVAALCWFVEAAYMQANNRLLEYFNGIYRHATPGCPNLVELSVDSRRILLTREPEHIKTVLTSKFSHFGKGPEFHDSWSPFLGDSIFTTDGPLWHKSRQLIRPMFTKDRVRDLDIFHRWAVGLMSKLPPAGETVDICDLFYRMTLDVTTDFLLGQHVGALDNPRGDFSRAFTEVQRQQMILTILYPVRRFVPRRKYRQGIRLIERFMDPYIESTLRLTADELEKLSRSDKEFTFLHNIALFSRDRKVIRDQIMAVLLAGRDTTASTLSWAMYELARYPAVWAKLRAQVLERVGGERAPSYEDLKGLTYLTHVLNETLRLYPAVPYNLRECLEDSTLPGRPGEADVAVLRGDIVIYSTLAMQRRGDLYPAVGEHFADPAVFSPERWERWTPRPWQYVPFNGGPRICIGQNFAMTEMAFMMVRLAQKYDRVEYRGDWSAQFHKAEIVGRPGHGVPIALFEPRPGSAQA
ncbi:cytochrome P450 alkane hydroxylase [Drechmeria coniospora]|uniref:Cytochrome P450 alkane hydroxylase n=1 Tax=Drechmeria coniospora TaxID=98403 RepID=A0A151GH61_DRECN|nr:cytochrome P450 alkane hydroxylase [Drechmeria coniospora]KYK56406.1 cytochrome P450 alkane hydroxylase [Drechmeria coniospora]